MILNRHNMGSNPIDLISSLFRGICLFLTFFIYIHMDRILNILLLIVSLSCFFVFILLLDIFDIQFFLYDQYTTTTTTTTNAHELLYFTRDFSKESSVNSDRSFVENVNCLSVFDKYKNNTGRIFNEFKDDIKNNTKLAVHKIRVFKRTFS